MVFSCSALAQEGVVWSVETKKKIVALTIDDGPKPWLSDEILNILQNYGVRVTFFIVGAEAKNGADVIMRMNDAGHEIGNHTYNHIMVKGKPLERVSLEIERTNALIKHITGKSPKYFRAPGGQYDNNTIKLMHQNKMRMINWSVNPRDYAVATEGFKMEVDYDVEAKRVIKQVLTDVQPGSIILMHNGPEQTVKALPVIIENLKAQGYTFVTITELLRGGKIVSARQKNNTMP
ncbi:MAG: polysaccharide deacetylase family protein [bacterium]